ncbi:MAG: hypothetical protein R3E76_07245 [Planctomycetota bacterium]
MKHLLIIAAAVCLLAGCTKPETTNEPKVNGPDEQSEPQPESEPEAESEAPGDVTLGELEPADSPDQVRAIELIEQVTAMRFKQKIPVYLYTPDELKQEIEGWGDDGFSPENILGFYKPSTKCLYMVPDAAGEKRQFGLRIHEATHGLQDQLYDLAALHKKPKTSDQHLALTALIEGEAVQVMIDALVDEQPHVAFMTKYGVGDMLGLPANPDNPLTWSRLQRVFFYSDGARFVQKLKEVDGYKAVDKAFGDLPVSSEQILHSEKYIAERDLPDEIGLDLVGIADALPEGWELGEQDTWGEMGTIVEFVDAGLVEKALAASDGWGGDVVLTASKGEAKVSIWVSTWDTAKDAGEFDEAVKLLPDVLLSQKFDERPQQIVIRGEPGLFSKDQLKWLLDATRQNKIVYDPEKR